MAPSVSLPEIDMNLIQEADIQQSYWLLYQHIKNDFVHKKDLEIILQAALVDGGIVAQYTSGTSPVIGATITAQITSVVAETVARTYAKLAQTGGIVRENIITGLEQLTS